MDIALTERIERLLARHEEFKRTIATLELEIRTLTLQRNDLQTRIDKANSRIDAVLERLSLKNDATLAEEITE